MERLWSLLKGKLGQHLSRVPQDLKNLQFQAEVDWMCSKLNLEHDGRHILMAARAESLNALDKTEDEEKVI